MDEIIRKEKCEVHTVVWFCGFDSIRFVFRVSFSWYEKMLEKTKRNWGLLPNTYRQTRRHSYLYMYKRVYVVEKFAQPKYMCMWECKCVCVTCFLLFAKNNKNKNSELLVFDTWLWCVRGKQERASEKSAEENSKTKQKFFFRFGEIASQTKH